MTSGVDEIIDENGDKVNFTQLRNLISTELQSLSDGWRGD